MLTIKELRKQLDAMEAAWNMEDYMGPFEDQTIMVDRYIHDAYGSLIYKGISHARTVAAWELGLVIEPENRTELD